MKILHLFAIKCSINSFSSVLQVRGELFDAFQEGKTKILVCTDVASRGVDPDVSMNEDRTNTPPPATFNKGIETFRLNKGGGVHACVNQCHLAPKSRTASLNYNFMKTS